MRLESLDGRFVELAVTGYQFATGQSVSEQPDWDANWLMIHGTVWDGDRSWEFHDPCMTTWEARELGSWLRGLGSASATVVDLAEPDDVRLWMTEPNLTFELNRTSQDVTMLTIYFGAEARPPSGSNDDGEGLGHRVRFTLPQAVVASAARDWEQDLKSFPQR